MNGRVGSSERLELSCKYPILVAPRYKGTRLELFRRALISVCRESMEIAMSGNGVLEKVSAAIRAASQGELPNAIARRDSLVADLGFDSLSIALLGLALEDEFHCPILLNDWIAQHPDPQFLSVGSLCDYLDTVVA